MALKGGQGTATAGFPQPRYMIFRDSEDLVSIGENATLSTELVRFCKTTRAWPLLVSQAALSQAAKPGEDLASIGGKGHARHCAGVFLEDSQGLATAGFPQPRRPVCGAGEALASIGRDRHTSHVVGVSLEDGQRLTTAGFPQTSRPVFRTGEHLRPSGENATLVTEPVCPCQYGQGRPLLVSHSRAVRPRSGEDLTSIGGERHAPHLVGVALQDGQGYDHCLSPTTAPSDHPPR